MEIVFPAPEEIVFEIISETPFGNDFLSAPEEIIFETISEFRWTNSAPEGILFEIMSATPQVNVFSAPEEIFFGICSESLMGKVF